jgi:ribosomal protein S18 acetylase RimI-like enzyme
VAREHPGVEPLDNPVWHALTGPQAAHAEGGTLARRFPAAISPFAAVPDEPDVASWAELATLHEPGVGTWLFRTAPVAVGDAWSVEWAGTGDQMVAANGVEDLGAPGSPLSADDAGEMLDLVERTRPGPFGARTVELGGYIGVRVDGRLVAMAGERLRLVGHAEVSAVCTDPEFRGRGLAAALTAQVARTIADRGEIPILHVAHGNEGARRVYERLGFATRATIHVQALRPPGASGPPSSLPSPR